MYLIDLPQGLPTSEGFNVNDLFENHGRTPTSTDVEALPLSAAMKIISEDIEEILDVWESGKHQGTHRCYLVH